MTDCPSCRGAGVDAHGVSCPKCTGMPTADLLDFSQAREAALRRELEAVKRDRDRLIAQGEEMLGALQWLRHEAALGATREALLEHLEGWLKRFRG